MGIIYLLKQNKLRKFVKLKVNIMDEQEKIIAKKIVSYLEEAPLDKSIENRLAQARTQALLKLKQREVVETQQQSNSLLLKSKSNLMNNWLVYFLMALLFMSLFNNPIRDSFFESKENVTLASPAYEDFLENLHKRNQEFQEWDNKMDQLLEDKNGEVEEVIEKDINH